MIFCQPDVFGFRFLIENKCCDMIFVKLYDQCIGKIYTNSFDGKVYFQYENESSCLNPFPYVFPKRKQPYCIGQIDDFSLDGFPGVFCEAPNNQLCGIAAYEFLKCLKGNVLGALEFITDEDDGKENVSYNFVGGMVKKHCTENWIVKVEEPKNRPYDLLTIEYSLTLLAKTANISCVEMEPCELNNCRCLKIKRFDRVENQKVHYESCHALAKKRIDIKKESDLRLVLNILPSLNISLEDKLMLFKMIVFNFCVHNNDCHLVNIGFLMDALGRWSLAPAFDISFSLKKRFVKIDGACQNVTRRDFLALGRQMGFDLPILNVTIDEVLCSIQNWPFCASTVGLSIDQINLIYSYFIKDI